MDGVVAKDLSQIGVVAIILFVEYLLVLLAVISDLWSGVRKAKQRGEARTSYGFKRTVDKLCKYYNLMIALTILDCMQIVGIWYIDQYYGYSFPVFPIVTLIGALSIGMIEVKSIYEKADEKVKDDYHQVAALLAELAKNRKDTDKLHDMVENFLNEKKNESE
jgi:membrane protein required for beta-lactamase induction